MIYFREVILLRYREKPLYGFCFLFSPPPSLIFSLTEIPLKYSVHISIDLRIFFLSLYDRNFHSQIDSLQYHRTQLRSNKQNDIPRKFNRNTSLRKPIMTLANFKKLFRYFMDIWFLDIAHCLVFHKEHKDL